MVVIEPTLASVTRKKQDASFYTQMQPLLEEINHSVGALNEPPATSRDPVEMSASSMKAVFESPRYLQSFQGLKTSAEQTGFSGFEEAFARELIFHFKRNPYLPGALQETLSLVYPKDSFQRVTHDALRLAIGQKNAVVQLNEKMLRVLEAECGPHDQVAQARLRDSRLQNAAAPDAELSKQTHYAQLNAAIHQAHHQFADSLTPDAQKFYIYSLNEGLAAQYRAARPFPADMHHEAEMHMFEELERRGHKQIVDSLRYGTIQPKHDPLSGKLADCRTSKDFIAYVRAKENTEAVKNEGFSRRIVEDVTAPIPCVTSEHESVIPDPVAQKPHKFEKDAPASPDAAPSLDANKGEPAGHDSHANDSHANDSQAQNSQAQNSQAQNSQAHNSQAHDSHADAPAADKADKGVVMPSEVASGNGKSFEGQAGKKNDHGAHALLAAGLGGIVLASATGKELPEEGKKKWGFGRVAVVTAGVIAVAAGFAASRGQSANFGKRISEGLGFSR